MTSQHEYSYRFATAADAENLVPVINRAFEVELQFFSSERIDLPKTIEHVNKGSFILAENDGKLAGCNYVELRGDSGYFGLLSVDPSEQGRGLGRQLVEKAEDFCRDAGCRVMRIRVLNHRTELPPFYEKLGYQAAGTENEEQPPTALVPYHYIIMEKQL